CRLQRGINLVRYLRLKWRVQRFTLPQPEIR
ncbi:bacterial extracellular solute-binding s, 5 Middle family protein, partial [Vibrio parahaemolyticus V-223/04]